MKIGFIGLGHLGKAMARRLISEGLDLMVWNRTAGKATDQGAFRADLSQGPGCAGLLRHLSHTEKIVGSIHGIG
jgi:6-phosphogluconate dehydrogenase (decarboxylating)